VLDPWDWLEQAWEKLLTIFKSLQAMTSSKYNWNSLGLHLKTFLSRLRTISSLWKLSTTPRVRMDPPTRVSSARSSRCRVVLYQSSLLPHIQALVSSLYLLLESYKLLKEPRLARP